MRQGAVVAVVAAFGILGGCSDSGGGHGEASDFETLDELEDALASFAGGSNGEPLPATGEARYAGYVFMNVGQGEPDPRSMIGDLSLDVDFSTAGAADPLSGSVSGVVDEDDQRLGGSLAVSNGTLDREDEPGLGFDLDGTLVDEAGRRLAVDGAASGGFGSGGLYVLGSLGGTVRTDGVEQELGGRFSGIQD